MALANNGAVAALGLLTAIDSLSVIAVDSAPHVVEEQTAVTDRDELMRSILGIESMGGGIFVRSALVAATVELEKAEQLNRHIILFSDAADSEEQEGCLELVAGLVKAGVTLSVIALGTPADADADFLRVIAQSGRGEVYFTTRPEELPRLFAQDTLTASRSTFVDQPTEVGSLPDLFGLGAVEGDGLPTLGGYNLTYLRSGSIAGAITIDDYRAPVFAFGYQGLGRTAAFTGQIGGTYGRDVVGWSEFSRFFVTISRWLAGTEQPESIYASMFRAGREAVVRVELDPEAPTQPDTSGFMARLSLANGSTVELPLEPLGADLFEARFPLEAEGIALGALRISEQESLRLAPVALPYSPEFEPTPDLGRGERLLRRIATESGGEVAPTAASLFRGERSGRAWRSIVPELVLLALLLLLVEIAGRRFSLWSLVAVSRSVGRVLEKIGRALPGRGVRTRLAGRSKAPAAALTESEGDAAPEERSTDEPKPSLSDALERAKRAARREIGG